MSGNSQRITASLFGSNLTPDQQATHKKKPTMCEVCRKSGSIQKANALNLLMASRVAKLKKENEILKAENQRLRNMSEAEAEDVPLEILQQLTEDDDESTGDDR